MTDIRHVDEEKSQSRARLAICGVSLIAFPAAAWARDLVGTTVFERGMTTILAYLAFSVAWYTFVARSPGRCPRRRYVSMAADLGIMTVFLHLGGKYVGAFYPIFLWIIIGNGIRFGAHFLTWAQVLGAIGFGSVVLGNGYWREHPEVGLGMLLGVLVLPTFYQTLLRRLRRMQGLEVALARSRLAEKAKDQFLAAMSHELRTPMNGVLGMAQVLEQSDLDDRQREQMGIITRSVESLLHVINDVLDYASLANDNLELDDASFDLGRILEDARNLLGPTAAAKGVGLAISLPPGTMPRFRGDPTRIRQVVLNLVGNAVKFTEKGEVRVECLIGSGGRGPNVTLRVRDTGVGIPADRVDAVFDQFEQVDNSTTRRHEGAGLGLAISRRLARMMGGDVTVKSTVGRGSTFTLTLALPPDASRRTDETPAAAAAAATAAAAAAPAAPQADSAAQPEAPSFGLKALVVEDNRFNQVVVQSLLKRIGIATDVAENGLEALARLDESLYDMVFMDVRMPVMNGYECTRRIRERADGAAALPIIAVTADATRSDVQQCLEAGMNLHLAKPVRLADIVEAIRGVGLQPAALPVGA